MTAPVPKKQQNQKAKNQLNTLKNQLNNWKNKLNKLSDMEIEQIRETINTLNQQCTLIGGQFAKDWNTLKKNLNTKLNNPKKIQAKDFKNLNNQLQQLLKNLK